MKGEISVPAAGICMTGMNTTIRRGREGMLVEMSVEELSQIYYINKEIKSLQMELAQLRQKNFYKPNVITDMPRGGEGAEQNLEYVNDVMMLEDLINYSLRKLQYERKKIEEFLNSIEDADLRLIMRLRAVNNMKWEDIGQEVNMSRRTVCRKFFGYFKSRPQCP